MELWFSLRNVSALQAVATLVFSLLIYRLFFGNPKKAATKKGAAGEDSITKVSHVHLQVVDVIKSKEFYLDFGFVIESDESDAACKMVLMKPPSADAKTPFLLLEEIKHCAQRDAHAADVGYARICVLVKDCERFIEKMTQQGYQSVAPAVTDRPGAPEERQPYVTIVGYADPDGNLLEVISLTGMMGFMLNVYFFLGIVKFPLWVHVNINALSYETSWKAYQALGMVMGTDYKRVVNNLYQALAIPDPGIAKQVSLIKFPTGDFMIDLIEWENPKTKVPKKPGSSLRLCIAVDDMDAKLEAIQGMWTLVAKPKRVTLPSPLNEAMLCTIADPDGTMTDLIAFDTTKRQ